MEMKYFHGAMASQLTETTEAVVISFSIFRASCSRYFVCINLTKKTFQLSFQ